MTRIELGGRQRSRRTTGVDGDWRFAGLMDEPETITPDGIHMRVHHGNGGSSRHHGFNRVTALPQDVSAGLRRQMVGGDHHAAQGFECVNHGLKLCNAR